MTKPNADQLTLLRCALLFVAESKGKVGMPQNGRQLFAILGEAGEEAVDGNADFPFDAFARVIEANNDVEDLYQHWGNFLANFVQG